MSVPCSQQVSFRRQDVTRSLDGDYLVLRQVSSPSSSSRLAAQLSAGGIRSCNRLTANRGRQTLLLQGSFCVASKELSAA